LAQVEAVVAVITSLLQEVTPMQEEMEEEAMETMLPMESTEPLQEVVVEEVAMIPKLWVVTVLKVS
jgi:hypothetical protein